MVGSTVGNVLAFLLGRYVLRDACKLWSSKVKVMSVFQSQHFFRCTCLAVPELARFPT
jgi:uncharacterized membrane protein YdjX (TVP38/TMEM64 family)